MSTVEARLRERCEALEDDNARLRRVLKAERARWEPLKLSMQQGAVFDALMRSERASWAQLDDAMETQRPSASPRGQGHVNVVVTALRGKLRPHGVSIDIRYRLGWAISPRDKAKLRELCGVAP